MSDNVVTELVIDADTTGADAYARAMDGAEQAASKGLEAVSGFNLGLAAFGISAAGAVAGVQSLIDWIEKSNRALADMALTAKQTGLSLDDFQAKSSPRTSTACRTTNIRRACRSPRRFSMMRSATRTR